MLEEEGCTPRRKYTKDVMDNDFLLFADTHLFVIVCRTQQSTTITTGGPGSVVWDLLFSKLIVESNHSLTF